MLGLAKRLTYLLVEECMHLGALIVQDATQCVRMHTQWQWKVMQRCIEK
jgi:hypothetical protein